MKSALLLPNNGYLLLKCGCAGKAVVQETKSATGIICLFGTECGCRFTNNNHKLKLKNCAMIKNYFTVGILSLLASTDCAHAQTFTKVTSGPVVSTPGDSRSVNWVDVNNDGWVDLMISNGPSGGQQNFLYLNDGSGAFNPVTGDAIVSDAKPFDGASWADTDNDGDLDCMVVTWYGVTNYFYTNNGAGTFTKVGTGPLVTTGTYSETCSWGDYDNDGLVDLYVTNSDGVLKNLLYHNQGNNTFVPVTTGDIVNDTFASRSVNWVDMDNDGDADLFVSNEYGQNENIYRNDGSGTFTKLDAGPLLNDGGNTMSSSWADYDNDGDMDVFLANDQGNNGLFRNDGNFSFTKMTDDTVSKSNGRSFSSAWSDIDNDGDLDLFVTNSFMTGSLLLNFLYLNNGDGSFTRVANTAPATDMDWSYGCAFGDYDNDGFEDLAVATCRFSGNHRNDLLYHNDGNSNNWITIGLTGTTSNKAAIGAKVSVKATINGSPVWQMRELSAQSSYCGQNDMRAHFGLGDAASIESILIAWPSGLEEAFTAVAPNQFIHITEGQGINAIPEKAANLRCSLFPNPTSGVVTLQIEGTSLKSGDKIGISDLKGTLLKEYAISKPVNNLEMNLKSLRSAGGAFLISITTREGTVTRKVIKL